MTTFVPCAWCRREIPKARAGQLYCSSICRSAAWHKQHDPKCPVCGAALSLQIKTIGVPDARR